MLADEPTGALDTESGEAVLRLLRRPLRGGAAGVLVTHEARHAAWADRVVFLRDGAMVDRSGRSAPPEALLQPAGGFPDPLGLRCGSPVAPSDAAWAVLC